MSFVAILLFIFGGFLAVEGALWAIGPRTMTRIYLEVLERYNENGIALSGLASMFMGLTLIIIAVAILR